jgi:hypothetical protein
MRMSRSYHAQSIKFDNCRLTLTYLTNLSIIDTTGRTKPSGTPPGGAMSMSMEMKSLDVGGTILVADPSTGPAPSYSLRIQARAVLGAVITILDPSGPDRHTQVASADVRGQEDGQRVANAIKRAGVLCGAPAGPF